MEKKLSVVFRWNTTTTTMLNDVLEVAATNCSWAMAKGRLLFYTSLWDDKNYNKRKRSVL